MLYPLFIRGVAATGIHIDPVYSGGEISHVTNRANYKIVVNHPVIPASPLASGQPFVQLSWTPANALPAQVTDTVDIDNDGLPDLVADFAVPSDPQAPLTVNVKPLTALVKPVQNGGKDSLSALIIRVRDSIVVRVPYVPLRKD